MIKKEILILFFCGLIIPCFAQTPKMQVDRRIYLWDVTLSMQGYQGKTPDIWDNVTAFLKKDIENISDENTELVILPFQENILADWSCKATKDGKKELLRHIDEAKKLFAKPTNTNIAGPFTKMKGSYVDHNRNNLVILLTDGKQNVAGGQDAWRNLLTTWHPYAKLNNAYLIYVMLTNQAIDNELKQYMDTISSGEAVLPNEATFEYINFKPKKKVEINVADNAEVVELCIPLENTKKSMRIPDDVLLSVKAGENTLIEIEEQVGVKDEMVKLKLKYTSKELKDKMDVAENVSIPLTLELLNQNEIQQQHHKRLILTQNEVELVLINKIQQLLTISFK